MYYIIALDTVWSTPTVSSYMVWERETQEEAKKQLEIVENRSDTSCCRICDKKPVPSGNTQMSYYDAHNNLIETIGEPDFENVGEKLSRLVIGRYF